MRGPLVIHVVPWIAWRTLHVGSKILLSHHAEVSGINECCFVYVERVVTAARLGTPSASGIMANDGPLIPADVFVLSTSASQFTTEFNV